MQPTQAIAKTGVGFHFMKEECRHAQMQIVYSCTAKCAKEHLDDLEKIGPKGASPPLKYNCGA